LIGDDGNDSLIGDDGNDVLYGGDGADTLQGNVGDDILDGENGNDSLMGGLGNDDLYGANEDDRLDGGEGNDSINGGYGNDWLVGAAGDDTLFGDDGLDTLIGGFGKDIFVAYAPNSASIAQADKIADFEVGVDKISLSKSAFIALQSSQGTGFSATTDFAIVTGIEAVGQSNAVIVYNTADNSLIYKPLGTAAIFAKLDGIVTVSANDFQITE
jgi:Ca2+-binding RTX toxin-like protein